MIINILKKCFNKIAQNLKLRWHLAFFQFFTSFGRSERALEHLRSIPLPSAELDLDSFQNKERKIWRKYSDKRGNLVTFTWKRFLFCFLKISLIVSLVYVSVYGFYQRKEIINEIVLEYHQVNRIIIDIWQQIKTIKINKKKQFRVFGINPVTIDFSRNPLLDKGCFLIPTKKSIEGKDSTIFIPIQNFVGDSLTLSDSIYIKNFTTAKGDTTYYVISPDYSLQHGLISKEIFESLKIEEKRDSSSIESQMILLKTKSLITLREKPSTDSNKLGEIAADKRIKLVKLGPVYSDYVWIYISFTDTTKQAIEGWIAACSVRTQFVETIEP